MRIETSWGSIAAIDEGEGPVVLLLHPLAQAGELWRPAIDRLSKRFRVIAPDARGHGASRWDGEAFTVVDLAEDAATVLQHAGGGPAAVVALSMGGCTAAALASRRPDLVDRLVLADTTADYGPEKEQAWETRARNAVEKPREQQLEFQRDRWFSPWFLESEPAEVKRVCDIFLHTDSRAHAAACRALGGFDDRDRLAMIRARTLVMVGAEDYATPPTMAQVLHEGIAGSRLEVLPETRHLSLLQNREVWDVVEAHICGK